jgi:predicted MFS family arabinose efflux permease
MPMEDPTAPVSLTAPDAPAAVVVPQLPHVPVPRGLWASRDFVRLWAAQTISELGSRITREGIPLTALLVLHAGAWQMGFLSALGGAAVLVFGLAAGVWIDRLRRRPVLIVADLGRAAVLIMIPVAAWTGTLQMTLLYAATALAGILTVFFNVANPSYLPVLVEPEQLLEGNAKLALSSSTAEIAGPALTGFLVQLITAPVAILLDALSFVASALLIGGIRCPEPLAARRPPQRLLAESFAGLRWVFAHPAFRGVALRAATAWVFHGFLGALYILFAIDVLGLRPAILGLVIATGGAGAMAGAFLAPRLARQLSVGTTLWAASGAYGLSLFLIPLAGLLPHIAVALLITTQLFGDMVFTVYTVNEVSVRQRLAPSAILGRINAAMQLLARGVYPIGALLGGGLATRFGVPTTLTLAAGGLLLSTLWLTAPAVRRLQ